MLNSEALHIRQLRQTAQHLADQATVMRNMADDAWLAYYDALEAMDYEPQRAMGVPVKRENEHA